MEFTEKGLRLACLKLEMVGGCLKACACGGETCNLLVADGACNGKVVGFIWI